MHSFRAVCCAHTCARAQERRLYCHFKTTSKLPPAAISSLLAVPPPSATQWLDGLVAGPIERAILTELRDPTLLLEKDKHYFCRRRQEDPVDGFDYPADLPAAIEHGVRKPVRVLLRCADDCASAQVDHCVLRLGIVNLVSADTLAISLNGVPLLDGAEQRQRSIRRQLGENVPYEGQWVEVELEDIDARPMLGQNEIEFAVTSRPHGLACGVVLEYVELLVSYNLFPREVVAKL